MYTIGLGINLHYRGIKPSHPNQATLNTSSGPLPSRDLSLHLHYSCALNWFHPMGNVNGKCPWTSIQSCLTMLSSSNPKCSWVCFEEAGHSPVISVTMTHVFLGIMHLLHLSMPSKWKDVRQFLIRLRCLCFQFIIPLNQPSWPVSPLLIEPNRSTNNPLAGSMGAITR